MKRTRGLLSLKRLFFKLAVPSSLFIVISIPSGAASEQVTEAWVARYNGPGNGEDVARALAVDAAGNVYVAGESVGSDSGLDYATIKYDPDGNALWVARYNGPADDFDGAIAIAVDAAGNVYVAGTSTGLQYVSKSDYATIKYDPDGTRSGWPDSAHSTMRSPAPRLPWIPRATSM